ncbi:PepSY-associated TM helix domain-containing protein [Desulfogranum marinum]|uniref:PepSY-associated TM helix domain-containing protein n=1 Tax=Desulfogranum marinum TaxID=453220 RepID=UPI0019648C42|nr:PepSY-associated TM helix domain-containing protein [Desulfogranum marinum]MBM9514465.1 PepSY-associated TM helix domain-containing protein [Desulfogranum marinum]
MRWRKWNFILHRDIGYLCIGLTLIYAISGVAVNHTSHSFNPSYTIEKSAATVSKLEDGKQPDREYVNQVLAELGETGTFKNVAMLNPSTMRIFIEGNSIDVTLATGAVIQEKIARKPGLFEMNYLHLNKHKKSWTLIADIYAIALGLLAVTGLLMIRGKNKLRGILFTSAGIALPLLFLFAVL